MALYALMKDTIVIGKRQEQPVAGTGKTLIGSSVVTKGETMQTFEQWLNRPVYKVQVHTAKVARQFLGLPDGNLATSTSHPIMLLRPLPAYRCAQSLALRKRIADLVKQSRATKTYKLNPVKP